MECTCQKQFFDSSSNSSVSNADDTHTLTVTEPYDVTQDVCVLDFGEVPVGKEAIKVLKLRNDSVSCC